MRLLSAKTLKLSYFTSNIPCYAILSHTWGDEEVTFQDIDLPERDKKKGFAKILGCCRQALLDAIEWVWIDTCCIDKSSSAELTEAINSMYAWYRDSRICYAFLEDVPPLEPGSRDYLPHQFATARWFTRGWCLQELIAPANLEFYAADWTELGTKFSLRNRIQLITSIPAPVLIDGNMDACSIAQKMSWASERQTTRKEDEAYCLLGIFGVNMPMLYGEGDRAFYRLLEEIIKHSEDYSLLLWTLDPISGPEISALTKLPVFANGPACFHRNGPRAMGRGGDYSLNYPEIKACFGNDNLPPQLYDPSWVWHPPQMTSRGLRAWLPGKLIPFTTLGLTMEHGFHDLYLLWTGCVYRGSYVCIALERAYNALGGAGRYCRTKRNVGQLRLLDPDRLEGFGFSEIYLNTEMAGWKGLSPNASSSIPQTWFDAAPAEMDVHLSSSKDITVAFAGSTPKHDFHDMATKAAGGAQLWRGSDPNGFKLPAQRGGGKLMIELEILHPGIKPLPGKTSSRPLVLGVCVQSQAGRLSCYIRGNEEVPGSSQESPGTDRVRFPIPDVGMLLASIKRIPGEGQWTRLVLRVSVQAEPAESIKTAEVEVRQPYRIRFVC